MTKPIGERHPWEKQKGESIKAFSAFALYRDLGPARTLAKVAAMYGETVGRAGGVHVSVIQRWSAKWKWADRVEAYDMEVDRRHREQTMSLREQILDQHRYLGQLGVNAAIRRATGDEQAGIEKLDPNTMDWSDFSRLMTDSVRVQRLAIGEPTDYVKGVLALTPNQVQEIVRDMVELCLRYVPVERAAAFWADLEAYFSAGGGTRQITAG